MRTNENENATCTYGPCRLPASDDLGVLAIWENRNDGNELWHAVCRAAKEENNAKITAALSGLPGLRTARPGTRRYERTA
jgi:hypothetical protein